MGAAAARRTILDDGAMRRLARLARVARLMDTAVRIPGTNIRFGADFVLGLVPVVGDAGGALVGLVILNEARRLGLPARKQMEMLANIGTDAVFGSVPLAGDLFDLYFKSHRRNLQIILDHFDLTAEGVPRR
ncbi:MULTISPECIES: DUF4112 domain-containing protein [Rhizobium]|uniref:DUF4112 domain-containing protein n=2 Tax=Rhizobium TaxID=379 RepID=A0A549TAF3_9HYPH|nr:DUF4112 domain-containing protein [Rhizobium straminoryzae]